jgi:hypothetical protein
MIRFEHRIICKTFILFRTLKFQNIRLQNGKRQIVENLLRNGIKDFVIVESFQALLLVYWNGCIYE